MKINKLDVNNYQLLQEKYHLSSLSAKVLSSMQLESEQIENILYDQTRIDDFDLSYFDTVAQRLYEAKKTNEKVLICGDYDCDGICATTIIYDALTKFGIQCGYYIPNRFTQGYGLHEDTVKMAYEKGYTILLTVDNGVKAFSALKLAKSLGMCVILSDHHNYEEEELICDYFLHPNQMHSYFHGLCGAGVAYLLARTLIGNCDQHTMLACVATIGDVVPLINANRIIVKVGLRLLNTRSYMALQLLQDDTKRWNTKKVAFQIVPKLNCVGRMANEANVNTIVKYLLLDNESHIHMMLYQINELNKKRKELTSKMEEKAKTMIDDSAFLILYDEDFHEGLNGIIASKINAQTMKPVMVLSGKGTILKGSIRSNTIDLSVFFDEIKNELDAYGGHKEAAGIAFSVEKLAVVKQYAEQKMRKETSVAEINCLPVTTDEITIEALESLSALEPYGCGFELPSFYIEDEIIKIQQLSNGKHLKYFGNQIQYLYFSQGSRFMQDQNLKRAAFIGKVEVNQFFANKSVNMIVDYLLD